MNIKEFNIVSLSTAGKLQPLIDMAYTNAPESVVNFVEKNTHLLRTQEGFEKFISAPELQGSEYLEAVKNATSVAVQKGVNSQLSVVKGGVTATDSKALLGQLAEHGLSAVMNSIEEDEELADMKDAVSVINSYEASANGDFGMNRIFTTLSVRLAQVTRARILEEGIDKYIKFSMGQCAFKKEMLRLGIQGQYLTAEEMASAVGSIDFENTTSVEINQTSIPVIQLNATVRWNRINATLNQAIGLSVIDELIAITQKSMDVAVQRILKVGVKSKKDGTEIKGLFTYPEAPNTNTIWLNDMNSNDQVESFAQAVIEKWKETSQISSEGEDAILRPFDTVVMPNSFAAQLQKILKTSGDYPVGTTAKQYFKDIIEAKLRDMTEQEVNVSVLGSAFAKGEFIGSKTGDVAAKDTMLVYCRKDSIFDISPIPAYGFNTDDNVRFQSRMVTFVSQVELDFKEKDIVKITKAY